MKRDRCDVVLNYSSHSDWNILTSRLVLSIKKQESESPDRKYHLVARLYIDKDKQYIVHDSMNLNHSKINIISSLLQINKFRVWIHDVPQAYIQSVEQLVREVYLKSPPDQNLPKKAFSYYLIRSIVYRTLYIIVTEPCPIIKKLM